MEEPIAAEDRIDNFGAHWPPNPRKLVVSWRIDPARHECEFVTLLARLDKEHRAFLDFHVLPTMDRRDRFHMSLVDPWLNRGQRLGDDLSAFCEVVARVCAARAQLR